MYIEPKDRCPYCRRKYQTNWSIAVAAVCITFIIMSFVGG